MDLERRRHFGGDIVIGVIDYGIGNIGSILNMYRRLSIPAARAHDAKSIALADRLILPGVGAFDHAMNRLRALNLEQPLVENVLVRRKPVLGICLGMQILADGSEEGREAGLGWIAGRVKKFEFEAGSAAKIPNMGWRYVAKDAPHPLVDSLPTDPRFYFLHSYHLAPDDRSHRVLTFGYGGGIFVAGVAAGHIAGVQFHPEKSHRYGMELLRAFSKWNPGA